jgi:hypothetical protein
MMCGRVRAILTVKIVAAIPREKQVHCSVINYLYVQWDGDPLRQHLATKDKILDRLERQLCLRIARSKKLCNGPNS